MAEKIKDADDRLLEAMLRSEPIIDDGFSDQVVRRIRRRMWVRRLALPVAVVIGGAFAVKPAVQLLTVVSQLSVLIPREFVVMSTTWLPSFPSAVLGAMLLAAIMLCLRVIEDE